MHISNIIIIDINDVSLSSKNPPLYVDIIMDNAIKKTKNAKEPYFLKLVILL